MASSLHPCSLAEAGGSQLALVPYPGFAALGASASFPLWIQCSSIYLFPLV